MRPDPRCDCGRHELPRAAAARRLLPALAAVLAIAAGVLATSPPAPAAAAWGSSATTPVAALGTARVGSSMTLLNGFGSLQPAGYTVAALLFGNGYVDLTNTSTVPARMSTTMTLPVLVAGVVVRQCSVPWNTTLHTCAGTQTQLASSAVLGVPTYTHTWADPVPAGGKIYLRAQVGGLLGGVALSWNAAVPRAAADRTAG